MPISAAYLVLFKVSLALVVHGGGTTLQAIDNTTKADCAAEFKNAPCILHAVNNRVVFGSR